MRGQRPPPPSRPALCPSRPIRQIVWQVARRAALRVAQLADLHAAFVSLRVDASGRLLPLSSLDARLPHWPRR